MFAIGANPLDTIPAAELRNGRGFSLGDTFMDNSGKAWVFCVAGGAITGAGFVVVIDEAFSAVHLSTANDARGDMVGISPVAVTSGDYFWAQRFGVCDNIQVLASAAANTRLNTTATAGALDDDGTAGAFAIEGMVLTTARAASQGNAPGVLNWPIIGAVI